MRRAADRRNPPGEGMHATAKVAGRLRDYIGAEVRILLVGINPGLRSAQLGHHFAGFSNRFWRLLHDAGLTPRQLRPQEDGELPAFGLDITNLVPRATGSIGELTGEDYARN